MTFYELEWDLCTKGRCSSPSTAKRPCFWPRLVIPTDVGTGLSKLKSFKCYHVRLFQPTITLKRSFDFNDLSLICVIFPLGKYPPIKPCLTLPIPFFFYPLYDWVANYRRREHLEPVRAMLVLERGRLCSACSKVGCQLRHWGRVSYSVLLCRKRLAGWGKMK